MSLQSVDDIHGGDGLPLGVLGVGHGITDDVLKEHLQDTTGLFVDQARDTLDTSTSRQTADSGLGDTLDVITQNFAMTLGASLSEPLSSFSTTRHDDDESLISTQTRVNDQKAINDNTPDSGGEYHGGADVGVINAVRVSGTTLFPRIIHSK